MFSISCGNSIFYTTHTLLEVHVFSGPRGAKGTMGSMVVAAPHSKLFVAPPFVVHFPCSIRDKQFRCSQRRGFQNVISLDVNTAVTKSTVRLKIYIHHENWQSTNARWQVIVVITNKNYSTFIIYFVLFSHHVN